MKTRKQVLADFYGMQRQLMDRTRGFVDVSTYADGGYWTVKLSRSVFEGLHHITEKDCVEWSHYTNQDGEAEAENLAAVAEFKKKFNLE